MLFVHVKLPLPHSVFLHKFQEESLSDDALLQDDDEEEDDNEPRSWRR